MNSSTYYKEVVRILDILQQTYVIDLIRPYHRNQVTELRKNPKVYFVDSGLRNYLINNFSALDIRVDKGALAENFVGEKEVDETMVKFIPIVYF